MPPCWLRPFNAAPIPCSRMPKRTLRPARSSAEKSVDEAMTVLFEPARSAEPPMTSGRASASCWITASDCLRVATAEPGSNDGGSSATSLGDHQRSNSATRSGSDPAASSTRPSHSTRAAMPRSIAERKNSYTSSGTANGGSSHPMPSLVAAISSAPSGEPCAFAVSTLVGAPKPMWVLHEMMVGRSASACASSMASAIAGRSCPSTVNVCHPYAANRAGTSSLNASEVDPSIVISLSS